MNRISLNKREGVLWTAQGIDGKEDKEQGLKSGRRDGRIAAITTASYG